MCNTQRVQLHLRRSLHNHTRWAWQSIPVLQLPPVQTGVVVSPPSKSVEGSSQPQPRGLVARVENRVLQVKEDNGVENALRTAEEILRLRRRWAVCVPLCIESTRCIYRLLCREQHVVRSGITTWGLSHHTQVKEDSSAPAR